VFSGNVRADNRERASLVLLHSYDEFELDPPHSYGLWITVEWDIHDQLGSHVCLATAEGVSNVQVNS
jgi:hypothetical protein